MTSPISFNERKAYNAQDCRLWTPLEALECLVRDIKGGDVSPDMVYVAMRVPDKDSPGWVDYSYQAAGGTNMELTGLLQQHIHRLCMPGDSHNF